MFRYLYLLPLFSLVACSGDISKNAVYLPGSDKAFIALGVETELSDYEVSIYRFDPSTKRIVKSDYASLHGSALDKYIGSKDHYRVSEINPGTYVIMAFSYQLPLMNVTDCLNLGTVSFDIQPGVINYVGDIAFHRGGEESRLPWSTYGGSTGGNRPTISESQALH
jgi:hypothetical protein